LELRKESEIMREREVNCARDRKYMWDTRERYRAENAALRLSLAERERVKDKQIEEMIDALKKSMRGCCGHMAQCCEVCLFARVALESVAELELTLPTPPQGGA